MHEDPARRRGESGKTGGESRGWRPLPIAPDLTTVLALVLALIATTVPASADLGARTPSRLLPLRDLVAGRWRDGDTGYNQRAIEKDGEEEEEEKKKPAEAIDPATPLEESVPAVEPLDVPPKSPARAFLLSAALPGLGQFYTGSNRGYLYLGVEAAAWITFASFKSSQNDKEDEFFAFADERFSIPAFEKDCVDQSGQSCDQAAAEIRNFYQFDKNEYYEIISKDPIFRAGWGVKTTPDPTWTDDDLRRGYVYENGSPPEEGTAEYRTWIADQAGAQDGDYSEYNDLRNDRNSLGRTARGMTMVVLVNHLVSAWDALMLARRFNANLGDQIDMRFKVKTSFDDPGASVTFRRAF